MKKLLTPKIKKAGGLAAMLLVVGTLIFTSNLKKNANPLLDKNLPKKFQNYNKEKRYFISEIVPYKNGFLLHEYFHLDSNRFYDVVETSFFKDYAEILLPEDRTIKPFKYGLDLNEDFEIDDKKETFFDIKKDEFNQNEISYKKYMKSLEKDKKPKQGIVKRFKEIIFKPS